MKKITFFIPLVFITGLAIAQCTCPVPLENGFCYGNDPGMTKEKSVLLQDAARNKDFATGYEAYKWMIANVPAFNKSLYQNGEIIINGMINAEKDPAKRAAYVMELMDVFERRIQCYGDEAGVRRRQGAYALPYMINDVSKTDYLFDLYKKIYQLDGDKSTDNNLEHLMMITMLKRQRQKTAPTDDEVLEIYEKIESTLEKKYEATTDTTVRKKIEALQDKFLDQLTKTITFDCDLAINKLCPKFKEDPTDLSLGRLIERSMKECKDEECYVFVVTKLFDKKPTSSIASAIATLHKLRYGKAVEAKDEDAQEAALKNIEIWYGKAIELCQNENCNNLYDYKMELAKMKRNQGKFSEARTLLLEIAAKDKSHTAEAYTMIGDMYLASGNNCIAEGDPCTRYAFAIAAYEMYQRAGNQAAMNKSMSYFPLKSDCFSLNLDDGTPINIGCWIGGQVNLRTRKSK